MFTFNPAISLSYPFYIVNDQVPQNTPLQHS